MRDLDFPNALLPYPKGQTHGRIEKDTDRIRSPAHMSWLHTLTCSVPSCRQGPIHAHHLTCGPEGKARSLKASDSFAVPVCRAHHQGPQGIHARGNERAWWTAHHRDPIAIARSLWAASPANPENREKA
jgi:hypothetical protein